MGGRVQNKVLRKILSFALAIALVFTLTPLTGGQLAEKVYAADNDVTVALSALSCDTMNDKVVLMAKITSLSAAGISGISFDVEFPKEFELTGIESQNFFGANTTDEGGKTYENTHEVYGQPSDKTPDLNNQTVTKGTYYLGYYSMDKTAAGAKKALVDAADGDDVVKLTFEVQDKAELEEAVLQNFALTGITAYLVTEETVTENDNTTTTKVVTKYPTVNSTASWSYTSVKNSTVTIAERTPEAKITTETATGEAIIKTDELTKIANNVSGDNKTVKLDVSGVKVTGTNADTNGSTATTKLEMSKTGAGVIADKDASLSLQTSGPTEGSGAKIEFDKKALDNIANRDAGEKLVIEVKQENKIKIATGDPTDSNTANAVVFDVTAKLVSAEAANTESTAEVEKYISQFGGGKVTVTLNIPTELQSVNNLKCWYIDDVTDSSKPTYTVVNGEKSADGSTYTFTTNHFSQYMLSSESKLNSYKSVAGVSPAFTISGTVKSYGETAGDVTLTLSKNGVTPVTKTVRAADATTQKTETAGDTYYTHDYSLTGITNLVAGDYTLTATKAGHASWSETITIASGDTASSIAVGDITINLYGDVNQDGKVTAADAQNVQRYVGNIAGNEISKEGLTNAVKEYRKKLANVNVKPSEINSNTDITAADAQEIQRKAAGLSSTIDNL